MPVVLLPTQFFFCPPLLLVVILCAGLADLARRNKHWLSFRLLACASLMAIAAAVWGFASGMIVLKPA